MNKNIIIGLASVFIIASLVFFAYSITGAFSKNPTRYCEDSDVTLEFKDGLNYKTKGTVVYSVEELGIREELIDYCVDSALLKEYICVKAIGGKKSQARSHKCKCVDGVCVD